MANLIIYYSRSGENYVDGKVRSLVKGNSEICAEILCRHFGGDLFRIETEKEYPSNYIECIEVAKREKNEGARPTLKKYLDDISGYDNVFVVGPCWWGTFPCAVFTQLEALDFTGKKVMALMTHEGSGLGHCERDLQAVCKGASFGRGLAVHGADAAKSESAVAKWAKEQV